MDFRDIKIGMMYHCPSDHPSVNYIVTNIIKIPQKILEMSSANNHEIELTVDTSNINTENSKHIKEHISNYTKIDRYNMSTFLASDTFIQFVFIE